MSNDQTTARKGLVEIQEREKYLVSALATKLGTDGIAMLNELMIPELSPSKLMGYQSDIFGTIRTDAVPHDHIGGEFVALCKARNLFVRFNQLLIDHIEDKTKTKGTSVKQGGPRK